MPATSPGEFYSIFPPFTKGFGSEQGIWDYVNGGVLACTAGELARGCFQHGYEQYGAEILKRVHQIARRHRDFLPGILRGKEPERPATRFTPLDLSAHANCDTGKGSAEAPGWVNEPNNYLIDFPTGDGSFRDVPFRIASPEQNHHRVCIGISTAPGYSPRTEVPIGSPCRSFYLLHAGSGPGALFGKLTIHYQDGSKEIEYIERGVNIASFWAPEDLEFNNRYGANTPERMQVAWRGKSGIFNNVGVWIASFVPRKSDTAIAALELESVDNGAKWFVLGITLSNMPPFLPPWSDVSTGMPNNWGAGCVIAALLEGLAGIEDTGAGFRSARVSPRWQAAGATQAEVSVRYPAAHGYVLYRYRQEGKTITLDCSSCADEAILRLPLPAGARIAKGQLNGMPLELRIERIEQTSYVVAETKGRAAHRLQIELA